MLPPPVMNPKELRCEYATDPTGIESERPRLSWCFDPTSDGARQTAYQIKVYGSRDSIGEKTAVVSWDSGRVESSRTHLIHYAGQTLRSGQRCWWQVRVWNEAGVVSEWSALAVFEMGLLHRVDWRARWITLPPPVDRGLEGWTIYMRREFTLPVPVTDGRCYLTARGLYQFFVNGRRVGNHALSPDWSDYHARTYYQTFDLADFLEVGPNTVGVVLSGGWFAGSIGFFGQRFHYGRLPWFLGQLELECTDGLRRRVLTDGEWVASSGPIVSSDLMQGEEVDGAVEMPGWARTGFAADHWVPVTCEEMDAGQLRVSPSPPLRKTVETPAREVTRTDRGWLVDFGQNMAGWVRARVGGEPGVPIDFHHGEVLDPAGGLYTENLREAAQVDRLRVKDTEPVDFEPSFTLHGFRYLEVNGLKREPATADFTAVAVHSDLPVTGAFRCSDQGLNRVWEIMLWGQRSNYVCVPTDCPQRDERLGWTGDAQLFAPLACYNMECVGFFRKFLIDIQDGQSMEGGIPEVAPRISTFLDAAPAWGDAFVLLPWLLYQMYGDAEPMALHFEAMAGWMDYILRANPDGVRRHRLNGNYGDWVSLNPGTDKVLIATAYWVECARLMGKMAGVLGRETEARTYADRAEQVRRAFGREFVRGDRLTSDTQTAYGLALRFGLVDGVEQKGFAARLVELLAGNGGYPDTGILGSAHLPEVLSRAGRTDQNPRMNSFNHVALGSMGVWLYRWVGGIQVEEAHPGFSRFRLSPRPGGDLDWAEVTYDSVRGRIRSRWERRGENLRFIFDVPANTEAVIDLPGIGDCSAGPETVVGGGHHVFERSVPEADLA